MLTLISCKPILFSSGSSEFMMCFRNFSRSRLISSICIEAITWRNWPKMISSACLRISAAVKPKQPDGRVLHHLGLGVDGHGEHAGHVDADVLRRQGAAQRDLDLDRLQAQVGIVLDQRHDERRTAVDRRGRMPRSAGLAEDHQHAVARAAFVLLHQQHDDREHDDTQADEDRRGPDRSFASSQQDQICHDVTPVKEEIGLQTRRAERTDRITLRSPPRLAFRPARLPRHGRRRRRLRQL